MFNPSRPLYDPYTGQWISPEAWQENARQPRLAPQELIRVHGMEGAKAYQMAENSRVALFDDSSDDDIVIIKETDGACLPSYRRGKIEWLPDEQESEYMTRTDFQKELAALYGGINELKGLILNGKPVQEPGKSSSSSGGE